MFGYYDYDTPIYGGSRPRGLLTEILEHVWVRIIDDMLLGDISVSEDIDQNEIDWKREGF